MDVGDTRQESRLCGSLLAIVLCINRDHLGRNMTVFFDRLENYYLKTAEKLRAASSTSSILPNTTDTGLSREMIYRDFLRQHVPRQCDVFLGGFLFGLDGTESRQTDIIVTSDTAPRFDFVSDTSDNKRFACVEGTLAVASVKSSLNKRDVFDVLDGIASIPRNQPPEPHAVSHLAKLIGVEIEITDYDDWPYKIVFACDGVSWEKLYEHLSEWSLQNPSVPISRMPNCFHVLGKYVVARGGRHLTPQGTEVRRPKNEYAVDTARPDLVGFSLVTSQIRTRGAYSHLVVPRHEQIAAGMFRHLNKRTPPKVDGQ
jgi:hypothetical protein